MTHLQLARHVERTTPPPPTRASLLLLAAGLGALAVSAVLFASGMGWLG